MCRCNIKSTSLFEDMPNTYHIEYKEMNYFTKGFYTYLICDYGSFGIDENDCNSKLLLALYKNN